MLLVSGCSLCFVNVSLIDIRLKTSCGQNQNRRKKNSTQQASLCVQVPPRGVSRNAWKLFKDYFFRKLKVPQEKAEETSTIFMLSPMSSLQEETKESMVELANNTPAFDWDWEEKIPSGEEVEDGESFESENIIESSGFNFANVSIETAGDIDSVEIVSMYTFSETDDTTAVADIIENGVDQNVDDLFIRDSSKPSENISLESNLTNSGGMMVASSSEATLETADYPSIEEVELVEEGGEVGDLKNVDAVLGNRKVPLAPMFSPQRNLATDLVSSLFFLTFTLFASRL